MNKNNNYNKKEKKYKIKNQMENKEPTENSDNNNESNENKENNPESPIKNIKESLTFEKQNQDLESISSFPELAEKHNSYIKIILSNNKLSEISEFFIFENLQYLDLSHNEIQKLESLSPLKDLQILILSYNQIKSIGMCLTHLSNLKHLDLGNNALDINDGITIKVLQYNSQLSSLVLINNKEYDFETAKYICLEFISNLIYLDGIKLISNSVTRSIEINKYSKYNNKNKNIDNNNNYNFLDKNKKIEKTYIDVKDIKGNKIKISGLKDYIKFKKNDFLNNKDDYEKNFFDNKKAIQDKKMEFPQKKSSIYYFSYLNSH